MWGGPPQDEQRRLTEDISFSLTHAHHCWVHAPGAKVDADAMGNKTSAACGFCRGGLCATDGVEWEGMVRRWCTGGPSAQRICVELYLHVSLVDDGTR